jgi:hypothetical protein
MGEAGYRTVADRFSIDAQVRRTQSVYDEELARAGVPAGPGGERAVDHRPLERGALEVPPA